MPSSKESLLPGETKKPGATSGMLLCTVGSDVYVLAGDEASGSVGVDNACSCIEPLSCVVNLFGAALSTKESTPSPW